MVEHLVVAQVGASSNLARLTDTEIAWLAGIVEGEGCLDRQYKGGIPRYPRIRVSMTDQDVIERVARMFGCRVRSQARKANWKIIYHAEVYGSRAEDLLKSIYPYMGKRRQEKIVELFLVRTPTISPMVY